MSVSTATLWWVLAGLAVAAELATGTFYLLMIGVGLVAGALCAHFGFAAPIQIAAASVVGAGATAAWHWHRLRGPRADLPSHADRAVNLDIGERVHVAGWAADGTTQVSHRGSTWGARLLPGAHRSPGTYTVAAVEGNWLVLTPSPATV